MGVTTQCFSLSVSLCLTLLSINISWGDNFYKKPISTKPDESGSLLVSISTTYVFGKDSPEKTFRCRYACSDFLFLVGSTLWNNAYTGVKEA